MPDAPQAARVGWTIDTLHAHLDQRMNDADRLYTERYALAEKAATATALMLKETMISAAATADRAMGEAKIANERRFEGQNEFRRLIESMVGSLATKAELQSKVDTVEAKVDVHSKAIDRIEAKGVGMSSLWMLIVGALVAVAAIADVLVRVAGK